jgi:PEP-CTERM/exosortase A-associated glycosyltransferase
MTHRILHILDHSIPLHSGYTFRTLSILRQQRKLGWRTFHLTSPKHRNGEGDEEDVDGWHFYRTPARRYGAVPGIREVRMMRHVEQRIEEVIRIAQPDILHAHSPVLNGIPALNVARRLGLPVVYEIRAFWEDAAVDHGTTAEGGPRYRLTRAMETYAARRVDHVTTICEGLRDDLMRRGISGSKITVIPNAVDADAFASSEGPQNSLRDAHGLRGAFVVGFIGSFYAYEGIDRLIAALPHLVPRLPSIRLLLVGGGPHEQELRELARRLGVEDRIVFAGRVPQAQVPHYYDLTDVMVYPRQPMRLTELVTPLKPLEAMAKKRLVIASDVGGHRELIRRDVTGLLFPPTDLPALCDTIASVAASPEQFERVRDAGYLYVKRERTWQNSVKGYEAIYASLTGATALRRDIVEAR